MCDIASIGAPWFNGLDETCVTRLPLNESLASRKIRLVHAGRKYLCDTRYSTSSWTSSYDCIRRPSAHYISEITHQATTLLGWDECHEYSSNSPPKDVSTSAILGSAVRIQLSAWINCCNWSSPLISCIPSNPHVGPRGSVPPNVFVIKYRLMDDH